MPAGTARRSRAWWTGAAGALLLGVGGVFSVLPAPLVAAQTEEGIRSLVAAASAQGVRMTYTVPDLFVVTEFMDGGGPVAQATVDSTGRAVSFASLPYPGENAVTAPGLLSFATGAPVPNYPFYARADYPVQPNAEVKDPSGSYSLVANAGQGTADGTADVLFGGPDAPVSGSRAYSSGVLEADKVKVEATSISQGLSVGDGTLTIASVTSRSVTTYLAGKDKPETVTELVIEGAEVGGQAVTIGPDGVHPGDQTVPVPIGDGEENLNQALAQAGITVKTIKAAEIEGGAAGDALEITVQHPVPGAENVQGTFVYQFGGATSYVAFGEGGGIGLPVDDVPLPADTPAPAPATAAAPPPAPAESTDTASDAPLPPIPAVGSGGGSAGGGLGGFGRRALDLAAGPVSPPAPLTADTGSGDVLAAAPPLSGTAAPVVLARDFSSTTRTIFAVLAVGGALLVSSSALWRFKAVLATWKP